MTELFEEEDTDGLLLIDASNAFNTLNRKVLLHNIQYICPPMTKYVRNCYTIPSRLFVTGGSEISSSEGTTQGDPLAMPVYAIGIIPLLAAINPNPCSSIKHVAYADDLGGIGKIPQLRSWWDKIVDMGPKLGYYPNAAKTWLVVKSEKILQKAKQTFASTKINVTTEGIKYLESFIGSIKGK